MPSARRILLPCGTSSDPNGVLVKASVTLLGRGTGHWYPVAKGFGQLLNLNCAFMVLPVARALCGGSECVSHCAAASSKWALCDQFLGLLDKNIVIHKAIAKYFIMFAVVGHSGALRKLCVCAVLLARAGSRCGRSVADAHGVERGDSWRRQLPLAWLHRSDACHCDGGHLWGRTRQGEALALWTFWASHHFFVAWFSCCSSTAVFKWWCLPTWCRRIDQWPIYHHQRHVLKRVDFWGDLSSKPDVITLVFENKMNAHTGKKPVLYREGHYLYLQCPRWTLHTLQAVASFPISSGPDQELEVNIRVIQHPHAWTYKVAQYLWKLNPQQKKSVEFQTRNPEAGLYEGQDVRTDGKLLFRIDRARRARSALFGIRDGHARWRGYRRNAVLFNPEGNHQAPLA